MYAAEIFVIVDNFATWSCTDAIKGQHTKITVSSKWALISRITGKNMWKGRDFPNPVGNITKQSFSLQ